MWAAAADFHDTARTVTDGFTSYRSFSLNPHQFDASWKRVKTVRRVIADLIGQIDQRAQWVKSVFLMCDLNPPQNEASWKWVETYLRMIFDLRNQFD